MKIFLFHTYKQNFYYHLKLSYVYKDTVTHTERVLNENRADNIEDEKKRSELQFIGTNLFHKVTLTLQPVDYNWWQLEHIYTYWFNNWY